MARTKKSRATGTKSKGDQVDEAVKQAMEPVSVTMAKAEWLGLMRLCQKFDPYGLTYGKHAQTIMKAIQGNQPAQPPKKGA